jgi:outer membrane lipoprotein SlyB
VGGFPFGLPMRLGGGKIVARWFGVRHCACLIGWAGDAKGLKIRGGSSSGRVFFVPRIGQRIAGTGVTARAAMDMLTAAWHEKRDFSLRRLALPFLLLPGLLPFALTGCSQGYSANTYAAAAAQQEATVQRGVIIGVRPVLISADGTVGAAAGGALGGAAGAQLTGGAVTTALGAVGGALVGGIGGAAAEQAVADAKGWEYIVQETSGSLVSVTQTSKIALPIGLHILVIDGKQARIVPDYTVQIAAAAPAAKAKPAAAASKPAAAKPAPIAATSNIATPTPVQASPLAPVAGAAAPVAVASGPAVPIAPGKASADPAPTPVAPSGTPGAVATPLVPSATSGAVLPTPLVPPAMSGTAPMPLVPAATSGTAATPGAGNNSGSATGTPSAGSGATSVQATPGVASSTPPSTPPVSSSSTATPWGPSPGAALARHTQ